MKQSGPLKHFVYAFLIAVVVYVVFYYGIEHRRTRNGPWQVLFTNDAITPAIVINEPQLKISNVKINFPGEAFPLTNSVLNFAQPQSVPFDVPFGRCIFEDTTFQPGTVVFQMFGHEIQLIPRVLTIDKIEYPWQSGQIIPLNKTNTSANER